MRQTSYDAWKRINDEGLVGPFQLDVYNIVYKFGPMTAGEAWQVYKSYYPNTPRGRNEVAKRIYELCKFTIVSETGEKRTCKVTKFEALLWDVTINLPVKFEKSQRHTCQICNGKGFIEEMQGKLF
jgi:hypothetical protein